MARGGGECESDESGGDSGSGSLRPSCPRPGRMPSGLRKWITSTPVIHSWSTSVEKLCPNDNGKLSKSTKWYLREINLTVIYMWGVCLGQENKISDFQSPGVK